MGNQRLFVLRGAVGCAAGGGITWGGREGREGGGVTFICRHTVRPRSRRT
jgi:hypothetical protein